MKKFVYIITDRNRKCLHVGLCQDMAATLNFYRNMPNLFFDSSQQLNRLVYFEALDEISAANRFATVSHYTRMQKEKIIRTANPDWTDLAQAFRSPVQVTPARSFARPQARPVNYC